MCIRDSGGLCQEFIQVLAVGEDGVVVNVVYVCVVVALEPVSYTHLFIKILMGLEQADSGTLDIGETVRFGYYSQDGLQFDEQMKVIDVDVYKRQVTTPSSSAI